MILLTGNSTTSSTSPIKSPACVQDNRHDRNKEHGLSQMEQEKLHQQINRYKDIIQQQEELIQVRMGNHLQDWICYLFFDRDVSF
jgi:hypothetical protein